MWGRVGAVLLTLALTGTVAIACHDASGPIAGETYDITHRDSVSVAVVNNGGEQSDAKLKAFIAKVCGGKYRIEPDSPICDGLCYTLSYKCEAA